MNDPVRTAEASAAVTSDRLGPVDRRAFAWFLGVLAALTTAVLAPLWLTGADADTFNAVVPALSWAPALSALVAHLLARRRASFIRWAAIRPFASRRILGTWALMLGVFLVIPAASTGLGVAAGVVAWQPSADAWSLAPLILPFALLGLLTVTGEEIGWRGALQSTLAPWGAFRASAVIALLWMVWHLPLTLGYASSVDLALREVGATSVDLLIIGFVLSAARIMSSSMWPAAWAHALMNSTLVFAESALTTPTRELADGPFWAMQAITWAVAALAALATMLIATRATRS
ncbi:CPBP family intramembrane metalloprotease [Humibacter sp. BT305]|nr:CPBP family intramembrane metalloprotease [Humibacter sp. BT305]